jgi:excisionase family DNA binding protein
VSTAKAAEILGYSKSSGTIQRLINDGLIEAEHGPGHGLLVYLDSVHAYLEHHLRHRHGPGRPRGAQL